MGRSQRRRLEVLQRHQQGEGAGRAAGAAQDASQANGMDNEREEGLCVVCIESRADTVYMCGHMCVCELCAAGLQACPICRRRSRPIRVFQA